MKESANFRKFLLLWSGELVSSIGGGLTGFGLGVCIFRQTGSAAGMGLVTLLGFLPTLLFSVPAGVLADRCDRRLLMMIGDGCSAIGILYILICMMRGNAALAQICTDCLVRTNIPDDTRGRVWGLIGFLSQLGYVVAYALSGPAADALNRLDGRGVGRGAATVIIIACICLAVTSAIVLFPKDIRKLEQ